MSISLKKVLAALADAIYFPFSNPSDMLTTLRSNENTKDFVPAGLFQEGVYPFNTFLPIQGELQIQLDRKAEYILHQLAIAEAYFLIPEEKRGDIEAIKGYYDTDDGYCNVPNKIKKKALTNSFSSFQVNKESLEKDADFLNPYSNTLDSWKLKHILSLDKALDSYVAEREAANNLGDMRFIEGYNRVIRELETAKQKVSALSGQQLLNIRDMLIKEHMKALIKDGTFHWKLSPGETEEALVVIADLGDEELEEFLFFYSNSISERLTATHKIQTMMNTLSVKARNWTTSRNVFSDLSEIDPSLKSTRIQLAGGISKIEHQILSELIG